MQNSNHSDTAAVPNEPTAMKIPRFIMGPDMGTIKFVENLVENHNIHYRSVDVGEHFIKAMVMNSVHGIPVPPKVQFIRLLCNLSETVIFILNTMNYIFGCNFKNMFADSIGGL